MWWMPAFMVAVLTSGLNPNARRRCRLVARLDAGDTIVHVESGYAVSQRDDAHLQFVSVSGGQRLLRISINLIKDRRAMIVLLAHELHHAREVARCPEIVDQRSMQRLYERLGRTRQGRASSFETAGAEAVSARVFSELGGANPGAYGKPPQCDH